MPFSGGLPMSPDSIQGESRGSTGRRHAVGYVLVQAIFILLTGYVSQTSGIPVARCMYLSLLFALCTSPLLLLRAFNDKYAVLAIFMAMYFVNFGLADFVALLTGNPLSTPAESITPAELAIILGAVLVLMGYQLVVIGVHQSRGYHNTADWSKGTLMMVGLGLSIAGIVAFAYYDLVAVTVSSNEAAGKAQAALGPALTFIVMLGHLIRPLGLLILAYGYAKYRGFSWFVLVMATVLVLLVMGFVGDTKTLPIQAVMLIIVVKTLVDNRLPRAWIIGAVVGVAFGFPMFQAYRAEVVNERGINHAQAVQNIGKVFEIAFAARNRVTVGRPEERSQTVFERASTKGNVELTFERVGVDTPFLDGRTLLDLPLAFVPRMLWPDKPGAPAGQLFNKLVVRGEGDTYVSPSPVGELYWNFGWLGVVIGMTLMGALLGTCGVRFNLADGMSATRLLVVLATVSGLCIDFEDAIATSYVVWLRSLAVIGLLHLLFARSTSTNSGQIAMAVTRRDLAVGDRIGDPSPRFPNVLR